MMYTDLIKKTGLALVLSILLFNSTMAQTSTDTTDVDTKAVTTFDVDTAMYDIRQLQNSMGEITTELYGLDEKELQENADQITDKYRETRQEIVRVINDITKTTTDVSEALKKINLYKQQLLFATKEIRDIREASDKTKEYIAKFTNFLYKTKNDLYTDGSNGIDDLKLMINSDNIPQTLANDYVVKSMLLQFDELVVKLQSDEANKIKLLKRINSLKMTAKDQIQGYQDQVTKLQEKKNYLLQFIQLYKNDKFRTQAALNSLFNTRKEVDAKIADLIGEIKDETYDSITFNMEKKISELADASERITYKQKNAHVISRPIYPIQDITTYFDDAEYAKRYGISHKGIQIKVKQGSTAYSSKDGIVYYVSDPEDGVGINRVMILHENGYVTTYMYLNKIFVRPGDVVMEGQPIGVSGGEPGTRGAGFISNGPNLTFGIFKNGKAIDPFNLLDLSVVENKATLGEGYSINYLNDKYARPIDITELNFMTGGDVNERSDAFINSYAVGIYRELPFREDVVAGTNIDRDVVICIGFAESTLGRHLTTSSNIGNVGNNDRGDRVSFNSAYVGARGIPDTLNNRYLGDYFTINQLSRYDNQDGKIYASSPINRQTNVLKCLSQIKGYYVPEDFPFRTGVNPNKEKRDMMKFQEKVQQGTGGKA